MYRHACVLICCMAPHEQPFGNFVQELQRGLLFPRFSAIQVVSATLTAAVAEQMVKTGEGSLPDDFNAVVSAAPRPAGTSAWEAYVRAKMFKLPVESKL